MICKRTFGAAAWLCVTISVACSDEDNTSEVVYENAGSLCLTQVGSDVQISAQLDACLDGCRRSRLVECEATVDSRGVVVTSRVEVIVDNSQEVCQTSCNPVEAVCGSISPPAQDSVTIVFGTEQASLDLPLSSPTSLFGLYDACPRNAD